MIRLKRHEIKQIQPVLVIALVLMVLAGLGGFWTIEPFGTTHLQQRQGFWILSMPILSNWFHQFGPFLMNSLAMVLALVLSAQVGQLRFQVMQPISRAELLLGQVKTMALVLGVMALVGTLWAVIGQQGLLKWGLVPFKSMVLLWMTSLTWGVLTLGALVSLKLPQYVGYGVCMMGMVFCYMLAQSIDEMSLSPIYLMQVVVPQEVYGEGLKQEATLAILASDAYKHSFVGDVKLLWALFALGAVYFMAQWGFNRRKLF